jgi:hypothetical protein
MLVVLLIKGGIKAVFPDGGVRLAALEEFHVKNALFSPPIYILFRSAVFVTGLLQRLSCLPYFTGLRGGMRYHVGKRSLSPPHGKDTETKSIPRARIFFMMMICTSKLFDQSALF